MRIKFISLLAAFLIIIFVACSPAASPQIENEIEFTSAALNIPKIHKNMNLIGHPPLDDSKGNCIVNELEMPGQRWRIAGSSGGFTTTNLFDGDSPVNWSLSQGVRTNSSYFNSYYAKAGQYPRSGRTAILIVDNFYENSSGQTTYKLGSGVFSLGNESSDAQFDVALDNLEKQGALSHGALVFNHANAVMNELADYYYSWGNRKVVYYNRGNIHLEAVNLDNDRSDKVFDRTVTAINNVAARGYTNIVVNMSFALVPCDVKDNFLENEAKYSSFEEYVEAVWKANENNSNLNSFEKSLQSITLAIATPIDGDPLAELASIKIPRNPKAQLQIVAAAGNYNLDYPMYPAAYSNIKDVRSLDATMSMFSYKKSFFSNAGKYKAIGAWHLLENPNNLNGNYADATKLMYAGTSFAAPMYSVLTGLSSYY